MLVHVPHVPTSSPLYNSCVTPRVFYVCSARRSGLCSACCGQSHLHRRPRAPARGRSHRATSCFRLENGVGEHRAPLIMRGTAVRPLTSTCAGGPEADETSSMSMSVSMSMSMLGTRPQRVGVFLLRWPQHHAARVRPVRLPPTCAPRHSRRRHAHGLGVQVQEQLFRRALTSNAHRHTACRQKSAGSRNPAGRS